MKKIKYYVLSCMCLLILPITSSELQATDESNIKIKDEYLLNFNNPQKQEVVLISDDGKQTSMVLEADIQRNTIESWGSGTHTRKITATTDLVTMSAKVTVKINPYNTQFVSISNGSFTMLAGTWVKDLYDIPVPSATAPNRSIGEYTAFYTLPYLGTFSQTLTIKVSSNGSVIASIMP